MDTQEGSLSYEDIRKQRLEENKKRMQELGLPNLSKNLSSDLVSSKTPLQPRQVKPRIPKEFTEIRRSSRVAANPAPDYREVDADASLGRRSCSSYSSRAASLLNRKYASDEARLEAVLQAETIMKELPRSTPSFVKPMLQSHTTGGFWLGLPSHFCKTYLPKRDEKVVLENEKGDEWETVFLANKAGLSGGWRGFSLDHGLVDGDALVFELIEHARFKVHIVRASEEAQDDDDDNGDTEEDLGTNDDANVETQAHSKENSETETLNKKTKGKKKQAKESSGKPKSAQKSQLKGSTGGKSESDESGKEEADKRVRRNKGSNTKKRRLEEDDDIEALFETVEEDITKPTSHSSQITSYMQTGKPRYGRVAKKPLSGGDVISVF